MAPGEVAGDDVGVEGSRHRVHHGRADPALVRVRRAVCVGDCEAVESRVAPTHIIGHGEDDVRARRGLRRMRRDESGGEDEVEWGFPHAEV